jgi:predicted Zn finger-like uncharacterized protein
MIIQCEKCRTRFKLDDSRVTESGIRVRCSRCSHTFVVRREAPEDESDFESILQGLGGNEASGEDEENDSPVDQFSAEHTSVEVSSPQDEENWEEESESDENLSGHGFVGDSSTWDEGDQESASFPVESFDAAEEEDEEPVEAENYELPFSEVLRKGVGLSHFQALPESDDSEKDSAAKDNTGLGLASLFESSSAQSNRTDGDTVASSSLPANSLGSQQEATIVKDSEPSLSIREHIWPVADSKDEDDMGDELSPLSISSRRKDSPFVPILLGILLILLLGGAGYYFFAEGSGKLTALLPDSAKSLLGIKKTDGLVEIRSLEGNFLANREAGEIFVMKGDAFNVSSAPLTTIQVKGKIFGANGEIIMQQTVFCGNVLTGEQLAMQPYSSMVKAMGRQFGETLANFEVQPGKRVPFVIVFKNVPRGAKDFGAEVVSPMVTNAQ